MMMEPSVKIEIWGLQATTLVAFPHGWLWGSVKGETCEVGFHWWCEGGLDWWAMRRGDEVE